MVVNKYVTVLCHHRTYNTTSIFKLLLEMFYILKKNASHFKKILELEFLYCILLYAPSSLMLSSLHQL